MKPLAPVLLISLLLVTPGGRADLETGLNAARHQNWPVAKSEFERAAEAGDPAAMVNLGNLYMKGLGVAQDYSLAKEWYQRAADRDDRAGQGKLGLLHYYGLGVPIDYNQAAHWFELAANQGEPTAETILASLYVRGDGVDKDLSAAYFWYTRALEQGHPEAEHARATLVDTMTPGEIGEALNRLTATHTPTDPEVETPPAKVRLSEQYRQHHRPPHTKAQIATPKPHVKPHQKHAKPTSKHATAPKKHARQKDVPSHPKPKARLKHTKIHGSH
ncbi:MAG: tetratricopeptide repeat protein [Methylococcaceae bacterium]